MKGWEEQRQHPISQDRPGKFHNSRPTRDGAPASVNPCIPMRSLWATRITASHLSRRSVLIASWYSFRAALWCF